MTHAAKTCIERPRKIGARYTGKNIGQDETISEAQLGYEAKRDRWNGYNPNNYRQVIDEYETKEKVRQMRKEQAQKEKAMNR